MKHGLHDRALEHDHEVLLTGGIDVVSAQDADPAVDDEALGMVTASAAPRAGDRHLCRHAGRGQGALHPLAVYDGHDPEFRIELLLQGEGRDQVTARRGFRVEQVGL
ncbi:hypothetical protein D3C87_978930 [compost metagenome]